MPTREIDGQTFRRMVDSALRNLDAHKDTVNALNVFPVPDGDTGSNMTMTLSSAAREVAAATSNAVGELAQAMAQGSLMGARGNSGVILSQLFRGFARFAGDFPALDGRKLARALQEGVDTAYRAVMKPVEGTILTVAREAATAATAVARSRSDAAVVLARAAEAAEAALQRTPDLLPVLKKAGVVDAGGQGYCLILRGFTAALAGTTVTPSADASLPTGDAHSTPAPGTAAQVPGIPAGDQAGGPASRDASPAGTVAFHIDAELSEIPFPYDTELFIRGAAIPHDRVRDGLEAMGDSVYVVGDDHLAKVHIHTDNPGPVLDWCIRFGELIQIDIKNMREQHADLKSRAAPDRQPGDPAPAVPAPAASALQTPTTVVSESPITPMPDSAAASAVVAVVAGDGLEAIFRSLGATQMVQGGQTMNPSTQDILEAINATGSDVVFVLPNNKNVILAAEQAAQLSTARVHVVPSRTAPQGLAALLSWQPEGDPERMFRAMQRTLDQVHSGEVTYAVRDTVYGDLTICEGDILGIIDGEVAATGQAPAEVLKGVVRRLVDTHGGEVITVYYGADATAEAAAALGAELQAAYPDHEVEVQYGGQPLYFYLCSLE